MNTYQSFFWSDMGDSLSFRPGLRPAGLTNQPLQKTL